MTLLEQQADTTQVDHWLRTRGVDPSRLYEQRALDLSNPAIADSFGLNLRDRPNDIIARSERQSFDYAAPISVGAAVFNDTPETISREIGGEVTVGTTKNFSVSTTVEASLFSVVDISVTASYGQEWRREETFSDRLTIPIGPGWTSWLERETVMRRITGGDFIVIFDLGSPPVGATRFTGTITGPGLAGTLTDRISVRSRQISAASFAPVADMIKKAQGRDATEMSAVDGVYQYPAALTAML